MSILAGISAGETVWCGLAAFLLTTRLASTQLTCFGVTKSLGEIVGYKHGFARRLFLYLIACLVNIALSIVFYTTNIIPIGIWVVLVCPFVVDNIIACKWFSDLEGGVITHYLTKLVNYLIKHGLSIHSQIQNNEIRTGIVDRYYHGANDISIGAYTSPLGVVKFIYKSIKSINTNDTERIIKAINQKRNIDPLLLWSIYRVWREKQNISAVIRGWDRHIGYHILEYTAVYAALWFINIYAAVATLFALNAISRHRNAAQVYKYNIALALGAIIIYSAQTYNHASNFIVDNLVCVMMSSGCALAHIVAHFKPTSLTTNIATVVKSSWLWPVLALAMGNRFAAALLIPKFYSETSTASWRVIGALMCGYFSNFAPLHIALLYIAYVIYTVNSDAAILLRATKVIADYTPTQFNVIVRGRDKKITTIIQDYI